MENINNKQIQALIKRIKAVYDGQPWYGTNVISSLEQITAEISHTPFVSGKKSIAEMVRHIVAWRQLLIEQLKGNTSFRIELNTELDWPPVDGLSWEELLIELADSQQTLLELLADKEDTLLKERLNNGRYEYNFRFLIEGVIQHDIYHLGQINLLRALFQAQGNQ